MYRFIGHWIVVAIALYAAAYLLPGVTVDSWPALLVGSLVLGLVNALIRPILAAIALPITILTLGLFYLVVNGAAFGIAAWLVQGFAVDGWISAILGALVVSLISGLAGFIPDDGPPARHDEHHAK